MDFQKAQSLHCLQYTWWKNALQWLPSNTTVKAIIPPWVFLRVIPRIQWIFQSLVSQHCIYTGSVSRTLWNHSLWPFSLDMKELSTVTTMFLYISLLDDSQTIESASAGNNFKQQVSLLCVSLTCASSPYHINLHIDTRAHKRDTKMLQHRYYYSPEERWENKSVKNV